MSKIDDLRADIAELEKLADLAQRSRIKDMLNMEIRKIQTSLLSLTEKEQISTNGQKPSVQAGVTTCKRPHKTITNYGWDQSDKFMKIYVTLNGIQKISVESVSCSFTDRSFKLSIVDFEGKDQTLGVTNLHANIVPGDCYHKVKTDMVLIMLKKTEAGKTWPYVIQKKPEKKEEPKLDEPDKDEDPGAGLMKMLKKMYDEGDDDMKRTIAKSWSESQQKQAAGGGMPGMGGMGDMGL